MATIMELNEKFHETIEKLALNTQGLPTASNGDLRKVYQELHDANNDTKKKTSELTATYNEAVGLLQGYLRRTTQGLDEDKINDVKEKINKLHGDFEKELDKIYREQSYQFDLALESLPADCSAIRAQILPQLEQAQEKHHQGICNYMNHVQEHVNNLSNFKAQRDQKLSAAMLFRGMEKEKAVGGYYTPFGWGTKIGAPEIDYVEKFSPDDLEWGGTKWKLKNKEEENTITMGATKVGNKKKQDLEEAWLFAEANYLKGRSELRFTDLPAAGAFKGIGPAGWQQSLGFKETNDFVINLNDTVKEDKDKGISAAENAITFQVPINAPKTVLETRFRVWAHACVAAGWHLGPGIDLGPMPPEYRNIAYTALIAAGFESDQIYVGNKRMSVPEEVQNEAREERRKLETAYEEKENEEKEKAEKTTKQGYIGTEEAIAQLAKVVHCKDLSPASFFALPEQQQKELFTQGSTRQRAEIMANYAFNDSKQNIQTYMGIIRGPNPNPKLLTLQQVELLDDVAKSNPNPDRPGAIFNALINEEKEAVLLNLMKNNTEMAAQLLMQQKPEAAKTLFAASLEKAGEVEKEEKDYRAKNTSKFDEFIQKFKKPNLPAERKLATELLKCEALSDSMIYNLYSGLTPTNEQYEFISQLAEGIDKPSNQRVLGTIVAQAFLNNEIGQVARILEYALQHAPSKKEAKDQVMSAVYNALPSKALENNTDGFYHKLQDYEIHQPRDYETQPNEAPLSTLYWQVNGTKTNVGVDQRIIDIDVKMRNLLKNNSTTQQIGIDYCYQQLSAVEIASALRRLSPIHRTTAIKRLVSGKKTENEAKLTATIKELGPFLAAKAAVSFQNEQKAQTVIDIAQSIGLEFLAQMLSVCYSSGETKIATDCLQQLKDNQQFSQDQELSLEDEKALALQKEMLLHLNEPKLTQPLLENLPTKALVKLINDSSNNKVQQAKIVNVLNDDQKIALIQYREPQKPTVEQRARLFASLKDNQEAQKSVIAHFLTDIDADKANQIIACWNYCFQIGDEKSLGLIQKQLDKEQAYQKVVAKNSKPSAEFLSHYLSGVVSGQLGDKFDKIMTLGEQNNPRFPNDQDNQQKIAYLMTVGQALAKLDDAEDRKKLFRDVSEQATNKDAFIFVRASTIIHLVAQNKPQEARELFGSLTCKEEEKGKIRNLVADQVKQSPSLKEACEKAVGYKQEPQQQDQRHNNAPQNSYH